MKMIKMFKKSRTAQFVLVAYFLTAVFRFDLIKVALAESGYYLFEMITIMPVVFILTALIELLLPQNKVAKHLGDQSGLWGNLLALVVGSISAGPIYAAFPICKSLLNKGAGYVNITIILGAWAVVKVPMLANEARFLGIDFMVTRWILTVIGIVVGAYVTNLFMKDKERETHQIKIALERD